MKSRTVDGPKLTAMREARGLSQTALAHKVGRYPQWISEIETGHGQPSAELFGRILDILGCSADDISVPVTQAA